MTGVSLATNGYICPRRRAGVKLVQAITGTLTAAQELTGTLADSFPIIGLLGCGGANVAEEIEIFRGDDKTFNLTVQDDGGSAVDLTNGVVRFTVRTDFNSKNKLIEKDSESIGGIVITDPTGGKADIQIDSANTRNPNMLGEYVYDVEVELSTGKKSTVIQSSFTVKGDVTF
jgi:hypothetical protein